MDEQTLEIQSVGINGYDPALLETFCKYAALAVKNNSHDNPANCRFVLDGEEKHISVSFPQDFPAGGMREETDLAHFGGVSLAILTMTHFFDKKSAIQTEIGDGVDICFFDGEEDWLDPNFLQNENLHFVEISGILTETDQNSVEKRIKDKHKQISKGAKKNYPSSVIVTGFSNLQTVKELHK